MAAIVAPTKPKVKVLWTPDDWLVALGQVNESVDELVATLSLRVLEAGGHKVKDG